jgi:multiple sugar transport system ATP-binding protein
LAEIELAGVTKDFPDGTRAVDDVDLSIADGEFMILVGPSGCGKTTALRMVAGLETISEGEIRIGGTVVNDLDPVDRDIAMVFQNYALYPHMSVRDNIGFPLRMARMPKREREERVSDAARMLGIEELLHRKPRELSGGQRQRVAMGRAVVRHPQAFLMDEPLSNLDAKLRVQMRAELVKLHARLGVTTIYVTHDQTEAMTLGQRVAVLSKGVVQQVDTPQRLYTHPANTFVASFIGSPAMNFLPGRLERGGLALGGMLLELPEAVRSRLARTDGDVLVGVRPEGFHDLGLEQANGRPSLNADVEITEQLGPETIAYVRVEGLQTMELGERPVELAGALAVRLDPRTHARPGGTLGLGVAAEQVHLFDRETGESLLG